MKNPENKLFALMLTACGLLVLALDGDATFLIFSLVCACALMLTRKSCFVKAEQHGQKKWAKSGQKKNLCRKGPDIQKKKAEMARKSGQKPTFKNKSGQKKPSVYAGL